MPTGKDPRLGETILAPTMIRMFGRLFGALTLDPTSLKVVATGSAPTPFTNPLTDKLAAELKPGLARIFGFSYEGHYYKLPDPRVFLVHGDGTPVEAGSAAAVELGDLGIEFHEQFFSAGVRMWAYDKLDMSLRIDITSGWLEDILFGLITDGDATGRADVLGRADVQGRADALGRADMLGRADALGRYRR